MALIPLGNKCTSEASVSDSKAQNTADKIESVRLSFEQQNFHRLPRDIRFPFSVLCWREVCLMTKFSCDSSDPFR